MEKGLAKEDVLVGLFNAKERNGPGFFDQSAFDIRHRSGPLHPRQPPLCWELLFLRATGWIRTRWQVIDDPFSTLGSSGWADRLFVRVELLSQMALVTQLECNAVGRSPLVRHFFFQSCVCGP